MVFVLGVGLAGYSVACALGYATWLSLNMQFGEVLLLDVGMYVQLFIAAFSLTLCAFLPSSNRVMVLENSHRQFQIRMEDVSRAYFEAHRGDREGLFQLRHEFDSVRERIAFLREHPDLSELEPSVIEVAAQMSHLSRELAKVYSDKEVARARDFLLQRQQEVEDFNQRLVKAKQVTTDMRVWIDKIEMEEAVAESQLYRLTEELTELLPELDASEQTAVVDVEPIVDDTPVDNFGEDERIVRILNRHAAE